MLKHGILGLLSYQDRTGYEIMEVFRDSLNFFWSARTSQIYRELQSMEKRNWVKKVTVQQQGKPDKNIYSITEKGKEELHGWLAEEDLGLSPRNPVLMKVFFMGERSREENIRCFKRLEEDCRKLLKNLEPIPQHIGSYSDSVGAEDKALYWQMTVDYGRRNMEMYIGWIQSCIKQLESQEEKQN